MELRHLRYFVAAAELENVSRAASRLHVSQPALSRQIRDLEEELGFPLFERSAKSVRLTEAGRSFLVEARAVLRRAEEAINTARTIASNAEIELHIGYAPSPTVRILPAILRGFQAKYPKVRVRLHDLSTEEMLDGVREGRLAAAIVVQPGRPTLRGLVFEELAQESMCLAVPPAHPLARLRSVSAARAAQEPLVVFSRKDYPEYHEYLTTLFAGVKVSPHLAGEHDSASSLITDIESGSGVAVVPENFSCSAGSRLKLIPIVPAPKPLVIGGVWRKAGLSPMGQKFWESARQAASNK